MTTHFGSLRIAISTIALFALVPLEAGGHPAGGRAEHGIVAVDREVDRGLLRVRNRTPFILYVYVAGVRVGWIKPFRTESLRGLRRGYHDVYATSRYGSGQWGPRKLHVPGRWNILPSAGRMSGDTTTALVSRIYRENRSSLQACDRLAQRRGDQLEGRRAELEIRVDKQGKPQVLVKGDHVGARLRSCYLAVTSQWKYPTTGEPYTVSFQHLHLYRR